MLENLFENLSASMAKANNYDKDQQEKIQYVMKTFVFEIVKLILIIAIFSFFGYNKEVLIILLVMTSTKPFIGGYHEDTQIRCFLSSVAITFAILAISLNSSLNIVSSAVISIICLICIWYRAPVLNPRMPMTKKELIMKNKIIGTSITAVFAVIALIFIKYNIYSDCITWTITFQTLLLFNKLK
jgi:accessory gene regulator B